MLVAGHMRGGSFEAAKASKQTGTAHAGLAKIRKLYLIERELRESLNTGHMTPPDFLAERRLQVEPVLTDLKTWLNGQVGAISGSTRDYPRQQCVRKRHSTRFARQN